MANQEMSRFSIFDGIISAALKRILSLKSDNVLESDQLAELISNIAEIKLRYTTMIIVQVKAHGGVMSESHENQPIAFTFAVAQDEIDFNNWIGTYGSYSVCPTRVEHEAPPVVECWQVFDVNVSTAPLAGDVTLLEDIITVIDNS